MRTGPGLVEQMTDKDSGLEERYTKIFFNSSECLFLFSQPSAATQWKNDLLKSERQTHF